MLVRLRCRAQQCFAIDRTCRGIILERDQTPRTSISLNSSDYYTVYGVIQMVRQIPRLSITAKNFPANVQPDDNSRIPRIPVSQRYITDQNVD